MLRIASCNVASSISPTNATFQLAINNRQFLGP